MRIVVVAFLLLIQTGCVGIGVANLTKMNRESVQAWTNAINIRSYASYRLQMAKINTERESKGLKPTPLMTESEWLEAKGLSK